MIGPTKTRKAAAETGLAIFRALRHSNHLWYGFVRNGEGHYHIALDPETWEWEYREGCGFTTCGGGEWGPNVAPASNTESRPE